MVRINQGSTESAKYDQQFISLFQSFNVLLISPGATRLATLGACPWLPYFAPSVLTNSSLATIFRTFGAYKREPGCYHISHLRCLRTQTWLPYFAPSVLTNASSATIFRAVGAAQTRMRLDHWKLWMVSRIVDDLVDIAFKWWAVNSMRREQPLRVGRIVDLLHEEVGNGIMR